MLQMRYFVTKIVTLCYSSSADPKGGKLSDEQSDCLFGSLNCEHGLDEAISISSATNINIPRVKMPNACISASSLVNGLKNLGGFQMSEGSTPINNKALTMPIINGNCSQG
jgi:hypothetical protein